MEGCAESVALDLEVNFSWVRQVILRVATALLGADRSFALERLKTGS